VIGRRRWTPYHAVARERSPGLTSSGRAVRNERTRCAVSSHPTSTEACVMATRERTVTGAAARAWQDDDLECASGTARTGPVMFLSSIGAKIDGSVERVQVGARALFGGSYGLQPEHIDGRKLHRHGRQGLGSDITSTGDRSPTTSGRADRVTATGIEVEVGGRLGAVCRRKASRVVATSAAHSEVRERTPWPAIATPTSVDRLCGKRRRGGTVAHLERCSRGGCSSSTSSFEGARISWRPPSRVVTGRRSSTASAGRARRYSRRYGDGDRGAMRGGDLGRSATAGTRSTGLDD